MFGRAWVKGHGTVVEVLAGQTRSDGTFVTGITDGYIMDIYPEAGEPFRAEVRNAPGHSIFNLRDDLKVGETVAVECDLRSKKARLDGSDPDVRSKEMWAKQASEKDRREAILQQPPAPDPRSSGSGDVAIPPSGGTPSAGTAGGFERLLSFKEIMATRGDPAAAEALRSESSETSGQPSIEQRLARLQQLRDDGVLTPEEYSAQRQRILDSL
jgi:hypothetical protein